MTLDREAYDRWVALGFSPVAAAFAAGADADWDEPTVDPATGSTVHRVRVHVPPPDDASNRTGSRPGADAVQ